MESAAEISSGVSRRRNICSAWLRALKFNPDRGGAGGTSRLEICDNSFQRSSRLSIFAFQCASIACSFFMERASGALRSRFSDTNRYRHKQYRTDRDPEADRAAKVVINER